MNAIARDGRVTVTIPDAYRQAWDDKLVRVIVIVDEELAPAKLKSFLLTRLQEMKIDGTADFAENIDAYLNGEKSRRADL
ncbi:hypothetical protein [Candidatus Electronema sp. PJ]|uniref:hypothetical protein n=1 Tax=Candidatus Electronema sp. PJ TaxID=3401572 RepID=UPI003AA943F3